MTRLFEFGGNVGGGWTRWQLKDGQLDASIGLREGGCKKAVVCRKNGELGSWIEGGCLGSCLLRRVLGSVGLNAGRKGARVQGYF